VITAAALTAWGPGSLRPALQAGSQVSIGSFWRAVRSALRMVAGEAAAEDAVRAAAIVLAVVVLLIMLRVIAAGPAGGRIGGPAGRAGIEPPAALAGAALAAVAVAWLFAWPYVLPWYDSLAWALLAAAPCSRLDGLLLARTTALALGYLPGRGCYRGAPACQAGVPVPPGLGWLETVVRSGITPAVLLAATVALLVTAAPGRRRRLAEPAATGTVPPWAEAAAGRPPG
jgi:alpha-1,6-mannosyltransferase